MDRRAVLIGAPLGLGVLHVLLIWPHYFVGSFDDDSSYVLGAKALLGGQGLGGHLASGGVVVAAYPPGYSALLAPLVWIWPHSFVPLRLLSAACYVAAFPLTWAYLRSRGIKPLICGGVLVLLALGPPFATFGSMIMAETPFLALFLTLLLLVQRWDQEEKDLTPTAAAVLLLAAGLVWLKEAALGMVVGLALWELFHRRHRWRSAACRSIAVVGSTATLLLPVILTRIASGVPVAGSRYSDEIGSFYRGGFAHRLFSVVPHGLWEMISTAIPTTLVPYLSPLPLSGHAPDIWKVLSWHVTALVSIGALVWFRRHRDAAIVIVPVYLLETMLWPYVNERRVILVVPVVAAWYVLGAITAWRFVRDRIAAHRVDRVSAARRGVAALTVVAVAVPLVVQLPRDYLFKLGQTGSRFGGSRYMAVLSKLGAPSNVVETDYLYSTGLFSGHQTARSAFNVTLVACYEPGVREAMAADHAAFLLIGAVNKPGVVDSPCLLYLAESYPWAVPILHTSRDQASVYEMIGPGTVHPDLSDVTARVVSSTSYSGGETTLTWDWGRATSVRQVSLGEASLLDVPTRRVALQVLTLDGRWMTVATAHSGVGDARSEAPFLLAAMPAGLLATSARVVLDGPRAGAVALVEDFHVLASSAAGTGIR